MYLFIFKSDLFILLIIIVYYVWNLHQRITIFNVVTLKSQIVFKLLKISKELITNKIEDNC